MIAAVVPVKSLDGSKSRLAQRLGHRHLPLVGDAGDVLCRVGDVVLRVEDLEHVAALDRHQQPPRQVAADLVLDAVGFVLEAVDFLTAGSELGHVAGRHGLEERQHLARACQRRSHVLLHGADRRFAEKVSDQRHRDPPIVTGAAP